MFPKVGYSGNILVNAVLFSHCWGETTPEEYLLLPCLGDDCQDVDTGED